MYINVDEKLIRNGGRKAPKMLLEDLRTKLIPIFEETTVKYGYLNMGAIVSNMSKVKKDLEKIEFDFENSYPIAEEWMGIDNLVGFREIENFSFFGCIAGGDWEVPVYFIIYHDGKIFRGYLPVCGNLYNRNVNSAIGNDEDEDTQFLSNELQNPDFIYDPEDEDLLDYEWALIQKDILARIITF